MPLSSSSHVFSDTCAEFYSHTSLMKHECDFQLVLVHFQEVVGRGCNVPDLEFNLNLMHVFGWIISIDDDVIHMCCDVIIHLILFRILNPKVLI